MKKSIIYLLILTFPLCIYAGETAYFYDGDDRLVSVVYDNGTRIDYTYDEVGNILNSVIDTK